MVKFWPAAALCALTGLALAAMPALGQQGPDTAAGLQWRMIGPFRGGRTVTAAGVPGDPLTYYFGAVNGGVWKTSDGGGVWTPIFDGADTASIGAIALAPSNPQILYVGTGEGDFRSDLTSGKGVYKSTDGGGHWQS